MESFLTTKLEWEWMAICLLADIVWSKVGRDDCVWITNWKCGQIMRITCCWPFYRTESPVRYILFPRALRGHIILGLYYSSRLFITRTAGASGTKQSRKITQQVVMTSWPDSKFLAGIFFLRRRIFIVLPHFLPFCKPLVDLSNKEDDIYPVLLAIIVVLVVVCRKRGG